MLTNLLEVYDEGYRKAKGGDFLGHRPVVSKKPLKYANYYVWQTWPEVDARRRAVGSALHKLFQTKELVGGQYETVGLWSKNCPSAYSSSCADADSRGGHACCVGESIIPGISG